MATSPSVSKSTASNTSRLYICDCYPRKLKIQMIFGKPNSHTNSRIPRPSGTRFRSIYDGIPGLVPSFRGFRPCSTRRSLQAIRPRMGRRMTYVDTSGFWLSSCLSEDALGLRLASNKKFHPNLSERPIKYTVQSQIFPDSWYGHRFRNNSFSSSSFASPMNVSLNLRLFSLARS